MDRTMNDKMMYNLNMINKITPLAFIGEKLLKVERLVEIYKYKTIISHLTYRRKILICQ